MFGNEDNGIETNVDKGCNGMSEGTVTIDVSEYRKLLKLAYREAILQDVLFAHAELDFQGKSLFFMPSAAIDIIEKYLFPDRYAEKLAELVDDRRARDEKDGPVGPMDEKKAEDNEEEADDEH